MKITKKILLTLSAAPLIFGVGCTKEESEIASPQSPVTELKVKSVNNKTSNAISDAFEVYGQFHNDAVEKVGGMSGFPNVTNQQAHDEIANLAEAEFEDFTAPEYEFVTIEAETIEEHVANNTSYGSIAEGYAGDLDDLIIDFISDTLVDSASFVNSVIALENAIYNSSISTDAKNALIGTAVIARYSGSFWWDAEHNSNNSWYNSGTAFSLNDVTLAPDYETGILNGNAGLSAGGSYITYRMMWDLLRFAQWSSDCDGTTNPDDCRRRITFNASESSVYLS